MADHLSATPLHNYPRLDAWVGNGVRVWVKHENHQPTGSFKVRNGLVALSMLTEEQRKRGVIGATRGNHGQGLAFAARTHNVPAVICVPEGNSPSKNQAMVDLGAELVVVGKNYDESVVAATALMHERGLTMVHSTNNRGVIMGASTMSAELLGQAEKSNVVIDAIFVAVGGGSQAVGAIAATRASSPATRVIGIQAECADAAARSWHQKLRQTVPSANTFADGLATCSTYDFTFPVLAAGLADFVTVSEDEIADAVRIYADGAHTMAEGAGAASLAGLRKRSSSVPGQTVAVVLSGGNIDVDLLRQILSGETPSA